MSKVFSVRVDDDLHAWVEERAAEQGLKSSVFVKGLIERERAGRPKQPDKVQAVRQQVPGLKVASDLTKDQAYFDRIAAWNKRHAPGSAA